MPRSPSIWVVIPTYLGSASDARFDHPTPLNKIGTLPRLLKSLAVQSGDPHFCILILIATSSVDDRTQAVNRTIDNIAPFRDVLNLHLFHAGISVQFASEIEVEIPRALNHALSMKGYGAVRTCQLFVPALFGAEVIIALDDDEIVGENYILQALSNIGKSTPQGNIYGLGGPYLNTEGSPYLREPKKLDNAFRNKAVLINETMRILQCSPSFPSPTPMAFGGNMVFYKELFYEVCFDPYLMRGEDIDYIINARIGGFNYFFDRELVITHQPPRQFESSEYGKMKQDVFRFIYERAKIRRAGISSKDLEPYPGLLLTDDFETLALDALNIVGSEYDFSIFGTPSKVLEDADQYTQIHLSRYFEFAERWPESLRKMQKQSSAVKALREATTYGAGITD